MPQKGWHYLVKKNATVFDTIGLIITFARKFPFQDSVTKAIRASHAPDQITFLRKLFAYVCKNTRYLKDLPGKEKIYTPDRAMREGRIGIDCKKYATFLGAALHRKGIKHYYKVISYDGSTYEHIYVIVPITGGGYITLDPVNDCKFNAELKHKKALLYDIKGKPVELHALGKGPGGTPLEAFQNSRTWENYYRPGYGPVGSRGSGVEGPPGMGKEPCSSYSSDQDTCEDSSSHGGPENCYWYPNNDPSCDSGLRVTVADPRTAAARTARRVPGRFRRRGFGNGIDTLNEDLDSLGAVFKMGRTKLRKLGEKVPFLILPLFIEEFNIVRAARNLPTLVIPIDLKQKIAQEKSWLLDKTQNRRHDDYMNYIGAGIGEATGNPPWVVIDEMFQSKDYPISGLGGEAAEWWNSVKEVATQTWAWVKSLFGSVDSALEDYPESARWSVSDWKRLFGVTLQPGDELPGDQPTHTGISMPIAYVAQRSPGSDRIFFRTTGFVPVTQGETFSVIGTPGYNGVYVALESRRFTNVQFPGQAITVKGTINQASPTYLFANNLHQDIIKAGTVTDGIADGVPPVTPKAKTAQMLLPLGILSFLLLR